MKKKVKVLSFVLTGLFLLGMFAGCSSTTNNAKLVLGLDENFPPMGFRDSSGKITGLDIDLAEAVAKKMNMELVIQPIDWDSKKSEIDTGRIDCLWNGFSVDAQRMKDYELTRPYMKNKQVIVVKLNSTIKKLSDLEGKKVAVQTDSTAVKALKNDPVSSKLKDTIELKDNQTCLLELDQGRVDAVACDEILAGYVVNTLQPGKYAILNDYMTVEDYVVAFKKGNTTLRDKIQTALDEVIAEGTAKTLSEKWIGRNIIIK